MQLLLLGLSVGLQTGWSKMCSSRSCQRPHCTRWGFFQPDFALTSQENGWTESPLALSYKGTQFQLKTPEACTVQQHPRDHSGLLKSTLAFFRMSTLAALSPLLIFHRNSSSITLVSSSYRTAPALAFGSCFQSGVWGTGTVSLIASILSNLWFFLSISSFIALERILPLSQSSVRLKFLCSF